MGLIDSFYFSFASDAKKLDDGLQESGKKTEELEKKLNRTDDAANQLGENFQKVAVSVGKAFAAFYSFRELKRLTEETTDHTFSIRQQALALNMSVEGLSKWQQAVRLSGGTADSANASIRSLRDRFVEMSRFGGIMGPEAMALKSLGLSNADMKASINNPMIAMRKVAGAFEGKSATQQLFLGKQLGFDLGTITLLSQGRKGLDEIIARQNELGFVTEKDAAATAKFKFQTIELNLVWENSKRLLMQDLYPALTWFAKKLEQVLLFLKDHKPFVVGFFAAATVGMALLNAEALITALAFGGMAALVVGVGVAVAALADDIYNFVQGNDSLIGRAVKKWPVLGEVFRSIGQIIKMEWDGAKQIFEDFYAWSVKLGIPWEALGNMIEKVWGYIKDAPIDVINWFGGKISGMTGGVYTLIGSGKSAGAKPLAFDKSGTGSGLAKQLMAMGWTAEQAAGIAGNLMQESGGNPGIGNTSGHYGLAQWSKERQADFKAWSGHDMAGTSTEEQLRFLNYEMTQGKWKKAGDKIRATNTISGAAMATSDHYEIPGAAEANNSKRVQYAQQAMAGMSRNPLNNMNSSSISNSSMASSHSVQVGDITVNTQATNGDEVAAALNKTIYGHLRQTLDHYSDGVAI